MTDALKSLEQASKVGSKIVQDAEHSVVAAAEAAKAGIAEALKQAQISIKEGVESLRHRTRDYAENADRYAEEAQKYLVERVKERPVTATLAGVGVGLLIGLLLASNSRRD